ncbi:MAG: phospholipid carrier-dependent glycosyltransferase [SAR202 cluster bacterium]|nr:phospholipid carrier-dependent glycosyltransferase [SAR202 cluster bacterium]
MDVSSPLSPRAVSTRNRNGILGALLSARVLLVLAMAATVAVGAGLRYYGHGWDDGYGYTPHPDERAILGKVGELGYPSPGTFFGAEESPWNPRWFPYGSFPLYLLKFVQVTYQWLDGEPLHDLRTAGRVLSATADLGTVVLAFFLGARMYGRREGLLAAMLVSFAVLHIQLSHFYAVDTILGLFTIAALYFMFRFAREGRLRDSLLAAACLGIGLATKVSQAPIVLAFLMAHILYAFNALGNVERTVDSATRMRRAITGLVAGGAVALAVFAIAEPYALIDFRRFLADFGEQAEMVRRIRDYPYTRQYIDTPAYFYHIGQLAAFGLGWPLGALVWGGLVYAAMRGMRIVFGIAYIAAGWIVPALVLTFSFSIVAIVIASAIAFAALLATVPVRSRESRGDALLLAWVVPYFLIVGGFEVKFLRYLLPISPVLILFGARMAVAAWDGLRGRTRVVRFAALAAIAAIVAFTAFYAVAYASIYQQPHTAVRTSQWLNANATAGSVILMEHWEEGLPDMGRFRMGDMPMYEDDRSDKVRLMSERLAGADYVAFFSNRLYGTVSRLDERYPFSRAYYELLFSGAIGYELVNAETAYSSLAGVTFVDDTFDRPRLPAPEGIEAYMPAGLKWDLGYADESFSVYDHPKGMVFANVGRLDAETINRRITERAAAGGAAAPSTAAVGLVYSAEDAAAQQAGGTWTDIIHENSWASRMPVVAWLLAIELIALAALPLAIVMFRALPDRGYLFAKVMGLLIACYVAWLLSSLRIMAFSRGSVGIGIAALAAVSLALIVARRRQIAEALRGRLAVFAVSEVIFLLAFMAFLLVRMANPDLWHSHLGGEKPMDMAYLNAVLKSSYMPPYDPWFGGGYINYYYWGQFIVASLVHLAGIDTAIAFNLAVPLLFAMTFGGAFSVVYNMAVGSRQSAVGQAEQPGTPSLYISPEGGEGSREEPAGDSIPGPDSGPEPGPAGAHGLLFPPRGKNTRWGSSAAASPAANRLPTADRRLPSRGPILAGLAGGAFVVVLGNLDGAIQVGQGLWRAVVLNAPFGTFDFWRSSRLMPPDPPGFEITEFPFFTFLFADLHAHLIAMPFTLLALGLALALVMGGAARGRETGTGKRAGLLKGAREWGAIVVLAVTVGSLRLINTWDFPAYTIIAVAAVYLAAYFRRGGLSLVGIVEGTVKAAAIVIIGYLAFKPYHDSFETFFTSVEKTTNQTVIWQFLAITGLFVFIIGSFFLANSGGWSGAAWRRVRSRISRASAVGAGGAVPEQERRTIGALRRALLIAGLVAVVALAYFLSTRWLGSTIPFIVALGGTVALGALAFLRSWRPDSPQVVYAATMALLALCIAGGLDVVRLEGDIDRMNSIFKFYLQVWTLLALSAAYFLWHIASGRRAQLRRLSMARKAWAAFLAVLILSASVYTVLGTQARLRVRFEQTPLTLNGAAYMQVSTYMDEHGPIDLGADYDGIRWLKRNVEGSPIVLEGVTPNYRWGGRISVYTGLPSIVGWGWHQEQQRWGYRWAVNDRIADVNRIYSTASADEALSLIEQYGVKYVYVGELERLYYPRAGVEKFTSMVGATQVYTGGAVTIFRMD